MADIEDNEDKESTDCLYDVINLLRTVDTYRQLKPKERYLRNLDEFSAGLKSLLDVVSRSTKSPDPMGVHIRRNVARSIRNSIRDIQTTTYPEKENTTVEKVKQVINDFLGKNGAFMTSPTVEVVEVSDVTDSSGASDVSN